MNYLKVLSLVIFFGSVANAQNYEVKWSPLIDVTKTDFIGEVLEGDDDGVAILKKNLRSNLITSIEKYDKNLNLISTQNYVDQESKSTTYDTYFNGKNIISVNIYKDPETKKILSGITATENLGEASKVKNNVLFDFEGVVKGVLPIFKTSNSPDKKLKVYLFDINSNLIKRTEGKIIFVAVVDENGDIVWSKRIQNDEVSNYFSEINDIVVNNKGDVFIVEKRYNEDNVKKLDGIKEGKNLYVSGYKMHSFLISDNGGKYKKVDLHLSTKNIRSLGVVASANSNNFQLTGNYGDGELASLSGVYYGEVNTQGEVIHLDKNDYSNEFIESFFNSSISKNSSDEDKSLKNVFELRKILTRADGGLYAVYECYLYFVEYKPGTTSIVNNTWYFKEIIVTSISAEGKILWNLRIPKEQSSFLNNIYMSIVPFIDGNQLGIIYNENPMNISKDFSEKFTGVGFNNSVAILRKISPDGKVETQELFKNRDMSIILQPGKCVQTFSGNVVLYGGKFGVYSVKDARLGIIHINK